MSVMIEVPLDDIYQTFIQSGLHPKPHSYRTFLHSGLHLKPDGSRYQWPKWTWCVCQATYNEKFTRSLGTYTEKLVNDPCQKHAELLIIEKLQQMYRDKQIVSVRLYISYSPCNVCCEKILNYLEENHSVNMEITFPQLYYVRRKSCSKERCGCYVAKNIHQKNIEGLQKLLNKVDIHPFCERDWIELSRLLEVQLQHPKVPLEDRYIEDVILLNDWNLGIRADQIYQEFRDASKSHTRQRKESFCILTGKGQAFQGPRGNNIVFGTTYARNDDGSTHKKDCEEWAGEFLQVCADWAKVMGNIALEELTIYLSQSPSRKLSDAIITLAKALTAIKIEVLFFQLCNIKRKTCLDTCNVCMQITPETHRSNQQGLGNLLFQNNVSLKLANNDDKERLCLLLKPPQDDDDDDNDDDDNDDDDNDYDVALKAEWENLKRNIFDSLVSSMGELSLI